MQYTLAVPPSLHCTATDALVSASAIEQSQQDDLSPLAAAWNSKDLLQGHKAVAISHNGSVYRLQSTKLGKLILTK